MHNIFFFPTIFKSNLKEAKSGGVWKKIGQKTKKLLTRRSFKEVVLSGLEPPTHGFSVRCSTN